MLTLCQERFCGSNEGTEHPLTVATPVTTQGHWPHPLLAQQGQRLTPSRGRKQNAGQKAEVRVTTEQGQLAAGLKLSHAWIGHKIFKEKTEVEALSH